MPEEKTKKKKAVKKAKKSTTTKAKKAPKKLEVPEALFGVSSGLRVYKDSELEGRRYRYDGKSYYVSSKLYSQLSHLATDKLTQEVLDEVSEVFANATKV